MKIRIQVAVLAALTLLMPALAAAIGFDEVRPFEEVFVISAEAPSRDELVVRWDIAPDHYLYDNRFLRFTAEGEGVTLGDPEVPEGERSFDELLGEEVIKFHDQLTVPVPITVDAGVSEVRLRIQSQGCLDKVLCYPPTWQEVTVALPAGSGGDTTSPLAALGASGGDRPLTASDAFTYEAVAVEPDTILVRFTPARGYYLYRDQFEFRAVGDDAVTVRGAELPPGTIKDDPEFGPVPVYFDQVEIPVMINRPAGNEREIGLEASFQGCKDGEICYPPEARVLSVMLEPSSEAIELPSLQQVASGSGEGSAAESSAATPQTATTAAPVSEQDRLAGLLLENPTRALFAFFVAGLLLAFTPCVFPMVPILSGIIAGQGDSLTTIRAFWLSLIYVLAMALTYTFAGVLAGLFGQNLQAAFQNPWIISAFVAVFIALALSMFGFYDLQLPSSWQSRLTEASNRQQGGNLIGVAIMGVLSALIVGPCVAPPLAAALIVIGSSGDPVLGGSALFALSIGMGVPLVLFGVSAGKLVPRAGAWMDAVKAVFGVGLLALAIWMLERIVQGPVILLLWGALAIASGVYLGAFERIAEGASGWRRLWKALGLVLVVLGTVELIGAASGGNNWLRPLAGVSGGGTVADSHADFERIKSVDDLDGVLAAAEQPAMLDFYADWCVECIRMERNTFPDAGVQALLERFRPLQADVTANDVTDQALMRRFSIIGPPAILFFDRDGRELPAYRLVGYFTPAEFSQHLERVLAAVG